MPQRHSKNNNDLAHFTYEEKRRLGFGTQKERLGKDSIKPFDACCLCLKALVEPLCCKKGHLFCKECIYRSLLAQKKDIKQKTDMFLLQEQQDKEEVEAKLMAEKKKLLEDFDRQNNSAVIKTDSDNHNSNNSSSNRAFHGANSVKTTAFEEEALRTMRAYWLPSATPEAPRRAEAPPSGTFCPEGSEKLKLKDLFPVIFTEIPSKNDSFSLVGDDRYMCPSCKVTLTSATWLFAFSTCGHVLCKKCTRDFSLKDKACCVCAKKCKERDVVEIERGGTGYAGHGDKLVASSFKHLGSGSGAAPPRPTTKL